MLVTEAFLIDKLGLEPLISEFFVRRRMPEKNEYWLNRKGYVSLSTGYIFIPVFFDLLVRKGIPVASLLDETLLTNMERILQSAGRTEYKKITFQQHIEECRGLLREARVPSGEISTTEEDLVHKSFTTIPERFRALRRADTFLYTFAGSGLDVNTIFSCWELTVPLMLMLDDFADIGEDAASGEENCLLDGGKISDNFFELVDVSTKMLVILSAINPKLAVYLRGLKEEAVARNMLTILKAQDNQGSLASPSGNLGS